MRRFVQDGMESLDTGAGERSMETEGMGWRTDGETLGKTMDLRPLVGVKRRFLTKERVQGSAGLSGVELIRYEEKVTNGHASTTKKPYTGGLQSLRSTGTPALMVTSPTPRTKLGEGDRGEKRVMKGKRKAIEIIADEEGVEDSNDVRPRSVILAIFH
jgi:hypothetical protein